MAQYKYLCRPCPPQTRAQCIQESKLTPATKRAVARAFESQRDTQDMWDMLQPNCLLLRREQASATASQPRKGGLLDRLKRGEEPAAPEAPAVRAEKPQSAEKRGRSTTELGTAPFEQKPRPSTAERLQPTSQAAQVGQEKGAEPPQEEEIESILEQVIRYPKAVRPKRVAEARPGPRMLVSRVNGHRILLPQDGEFVLGRFDPSAKAVPDVDLSFENSQAQGVSRCHAKIVAYQGQYVIEDLRGSNGTSINDQTLEPGKMHTLTIGDEVWFGLCSFYFDIVPALWRMPLSHGQCFLYVTYTGRYFPIPDKDAILIGRADASLEAQPDIDLGNEAAAAGTVSRRHARLIRQGERFLIEDLGSTNRTKVNGKRISPESPEPIYPGQHLWLGGYTLAFDVIEKFVITSV
ncbi:MAG: FHA domain-containing protein [Anaerolineae bacterium]|nr:FHA domain-containing protein [Anaerolineae bacterium]